MDYLPNVDAVVWFAREIWPLIEKSPRVEVNRFMNRFSEPVQTGPVKGRKEKSARLRLAAGTITGVDLMREGGFPGPSRAVEFLRPLGC